MYRMAKPVRIFVTCLLIPVAIFLGLIGALVTYVIALLITVQIAVDLSFSAAAFIIICYGLMRLIIRWAGSKHHRKQAAILTIMASSTIAGIVAYPTLSDWAKTVPDGVGEAVLKPLEANTMPLKTCDFGSSFDDLQFLKSILQDKRIIALGEATHGTSEFFRMKHRILEFLVEQMGFQHFGMEMPVEHGDIVRTYIMGNDVDLAEVLWPCWARVEVMDMIEWMRTYNAKVESARKVVFHGFSQECARDREMAENVLRILGEAGPDSKIVLWAHNGHIVSTAGRMGGYLKQEFGEQAYLLGFEFDHGRFASTFGNYVVRPASPAYYAHALSQLDSSTLFLDFETMSQDPELRKWLAIPKRSHDQAELHAVFRFFPWGHYRYASWSQLYDGLIFIEESTPSTRLVEQM